MAIKTKKCPYCGETIMADANKCRYCKEWLQKPSYDKVANKNDTADVPSNNQSVNDTPVGEVKPRKGITFAKVLRIISQILEYIIKGAILAFFIWKLMD